MWCARWGCVLAVSALAERIHVLEQVRLQNFLLTALRGLEFMTACVWVVLVPVEELPELKSCEVVGEYQVPKEGRELETCTFGKGALAGPAHRARKHHRAGQHHIPRALEQGRMRDDWWHAVRVW
ncbi:unnamed protein product [Effrenium voratum]|nr:unnamed protein product [Effrenium voratum]